MARSRTRSRRPNRAAPAAWTRILENCLEVDAVTAVVLASKDGLLLDSAGLATLDMEAFAVEAALAYGATETLAELFETEKARSFSTEHEKGKVFLVDAGDFLLAVVANREANRGAVELAMRETCVRLAPTL